jgi:hypothetical protein
MKTKFDGLLVDNWLLFAKLCYRYLAFPNFRETNPRFLSPEAPTMRTLMLFPVTKTFTGMQARLVYFFTLLAMFVASSAAMRAQSTSGFTYNGIVYTSYQANEYLETPQGSQGTAALRATGANYASVVVTQYVQTSTSNTIAPETATSAGYNSNTDPLTPTDAAVVAAIQNLQAQGLTVFLKPHVDSLDGTFRGDFNPTNPAAWFASYQTFILHYAQLASQNNVGGLVIGTELASLSNSAYLSYWTNIITQIRTQYPSLTLAYGANATSATDEFTTVSFWSQVDIIGVDGYFPLTNQANPTVAQLVAAWTDNKSGLNIVQALKNLQSTYNKPLIFTELGYVSAPGTNEAPYMSAAAGATYDPTEQEDCYEAFFEVFSQETSWMKGVFWWEWTVSPPAANDTGYSPQTKPAATVTLPKWYGSTTQGFTIAPSNSILQVGQGLSAPDTISVTDQGGFTGAVTLSVANLPNGVTANFIPGSVAGTQVLTFTALSGAATGVTNVTVTGTSGAITASTTIALNVEAADAQTITFSNPGPQTVGTPLTLSASSTSGLSVSFASSTTNVCTVNGNAATFLVPGNCTISASQSGNSIYAAAPSVAQTFAVSTLPTVPVPATADVIVSQVNWLHTLGGNAITSNDPAGSSFAVNSSGSIVEATSSSLVLFNAQTGAEVTLGSSNGAGAVAVDKNNNIYLGNLYSSLPIIKLPYVGGTANGGYATFMTPSASAPPAACAAGATTECSITSAGATNVGALAFDAAGDLFWVTAYSGTGENAIYECSVACLGGTGAPVQIYQEPAATTTPSTSSGQLLIGSIAFDAAGNLFFTDSSLYVNTSTYAYTSFSSNLKELQRVTGAVDASASTGYATLPTLLYSEVPSSIGTYNNQVDAVTVNQSNGTVYFADQSNGILAFPDTPTGIPTANGQPTALYTVTPQTAKTLAIDAAGNLYVTVYSNTLSSGGDTVGQLTLSNVTVSPSAVGTAVSPSATLNPVTTVLNDGSCSSTPAPSVTFAGASATAMASAAAGSCASTVTGGSSFPTNVSFTPSTGGTDSITLTATDQLANSATFTITGQTVTAQTITFANPGTQTVGAPLTLTATSTSGLVVTFTSATPSVCTVSGTTATFLTTGTCTIDANQAGNTSYTAAAQVQQSFTVNASPTYTLVATTPTVALNQGSNASDTVTVTPANGFTGNVTLAATGLPTGVTASFGTNPAAGASVLTFTATSTATTGLATVTITGTSGTLTASVTIALTVNGAPSFTLAPTAGTLSVVPGSTATDTINVTAANGFASGVTLTATGLPAGVTASFGTNPATGSSLLTLAATSTATTGPATVTITGTSGSLTASTTIAVTVNAPPSFTLAPVAAVLSVTQGASAPDTVNVTAANGFTGSVTLTATGLPAGVTASFGTNPATGSSVLTFTAASTATTGPATVTITGTSGTLTASATIALTVNAAPSFTLAPTTGSLSLDQGASATDTINLTAVNGFTGSVTLTATGLPTGVTASFGTNPTTSSSVITFAATTSAAPGNSTVTITGASGSLSSTTMLNLTIGVAPGITLSPSTPSITVTQGSSGTDAITVSGTNGFSGTVAFSAAVTATPQGAQDLPTVTFGSTSPVTITSAAPGTATLRVSTTASNSGALLLPARGASPFILGGGAALACLFGFCLPTRRRRLPIVLAIFAMICIVGSMTGCGGGSSGGGSTGGTTGTTAGSYTVTVTATSGNVSTTLPVTITVQ